MLTCAAISYGSYSLTKLPKDYFGSEHVLEGNLLNIASGSIILRKDQTYMALEYWADFTCFSNGEYLIKNDTLYLEEKVEHETDSRFSPVYFFVNNTTLAPVFKNQLSEKSEFWIDITMRKI